MRQLLFSTIALTLAQPLLGEPVRGMTEIYGVSLRWETPSESGDTEFRERLAALRAELAQALDPDCRWRKRDEQGHCPNAYPQRTAAIEKLAAEISEETGGLFNVVTEKEGKQVRDFDGLSQGYFLEILRLSMSVPWSSDFAGDIYVSPTLNSERKLSIGDPLIEAVSLAEVKMPGGGWMIASASRALGGKLRNPNAKDWKEDFQKIVIFAAPEVNGARVDGWATAAIVGGEPVLKRLAELEQYQGKWAYFGFDSESRIIHSPELKVDLSADPISIEVPHWNKKTP